MGKKLGGTIAKQGKIYIIDETTDALEIVKNYTNAGQFSINISDGDKIIVAKAFTGEVEGYGSITPVIDSSLLDISADQGGYRTFADSYTPDYHLDYLIQKGYADGTYTLRHRWGTVEGVDQFTDITCEVYEYDGDTILTSNTNYGSAGNTDYMTMVRFNGGLQINSGVTVSTPNNKKGLMLYVGGNFVLNGNITMSQKGYNTVSHNVRLMESTSYSHFISDTGGAGGIAKRNDDSYRDGTNGEAGANNAGGGGGGGGSRLARFVWTEAGEAGGSFGGGDGGSGVYDGVLGGSAAGRGNPGGLITVYVEGNVIIDSGGSMTAHGTDSTSSYQGTSGGGIINLFYKGSLTNNGSITANGGQELHSYTGGGGSGSITVQKI